MKIRFALSLLLAATSTAPGLQAAVEQIIGAPITAAVSEPFSVDFDTDKTLYGVEFTKSNRVFRWKDGKLDFIAGVQHNTEKIKGLARWEMAVIRKRPSSMECMTSRSPTMAKHPG